MMYLNSLKRVSNSAFFTEDLAQMKIVPAGAETIFLNDIFY